MATPITAPTQAHLEIEDIQEDMVLLKGGGVCIVLQTTAVNFGLLSEKEQDAMIYAYAGLLNSLSFPMQIIIRSKQMDISSYLDLLHQQEKKQPNEALRLQIKKYRDFVSSLIHENNVLDKKFYVVIPFFSTELGVSSASKSLMGGGHKLPFPKNYIFEQGKNNLLPKREHLIKQFSRIGLKTRQLNTQELIELFYYIYNPASEGSLKLQSTTDVYTSPIIQPAIEQQPQEKITQVPVPNLAIKTNSMETKLVEDRQKTQSVYKQSLQEKLTNKTQAGGIE